MQFSLVICTYMRPDALLRLLKSVEKQTMYPDQIIVVDGSTNDATQHVLESQPFPKLEYHKVDENQRGLTKQRNFGINKVKEDAEVVCFLDDDVVLEANFFEQLLLPFSEEDIIGCDGLIMNENYWQPIQEDTDVPKNANVLDGYFLPLSSRDALRAKLGLYPYEVQPGIIPRYGHGKSSLPPTGKWYEVEHIMGGITAYRTAVFEKIQFSTFFEGYGLYEDFDFSVRASAYGKLLTNTAARLNHYHHQSGRPNFYKYGKMVSRNGWYVWRLKHPQPGVSSKVKWYTISLLLALTRLSNSLRPPFKSDGWREFLGRITGLIALQFRKPTAS